MSDPLVSLTRQSDYEPDAVLAAMRNLLAPLGGMAAFVKPGQRVVLKPNLVMAYDVDHAATTHPSVVYAAATLAIEAGGNVCLGDSPGIGSARSVATKGGIASVCDQLGVEIIEFTPQETIDESRTFKKLSLAKELLEADVVINLAKLKTHCQMHMTMAVKNLFGAVVGPSKFQWHYRAGKDKLTFATMLYEICMAIRPTLSIVDAIVAMDHNGPTHGKPNPTGFLAAGVDPCAIDAVLLDIIQQPRESLWTLQAAKACGNRSWEQARTIGASITALHPQTWTPADTQSLAMLGPGWLRNVPWFGDWMRNRITAKPYVLEASCKRCGACVKICPAQVMTQTETGVDIDVKNCIRCYCCHELCPHDAVRLRKGLLARWIGC